MSKENNSRDSSPGGVIMLLIAILVGVALFLSPSRVFYEVQTILLAVAVLLLIGILVSVATR